LKDAPEPVRGLRPDVPPAVEAAIMRCLEKKPAARFSNVAELASAIVDFAPKRARICAERSARVLRGAGVQTASLPPLISRAPDPQPAPITVSTATAGAWSHAEPGADPSRPTATAGRTKWAVAGGIALAGIGGLLAWQMSTAAPVAQTTVLADPSAAASRIPAHADPVVTRDPIGKIEPSAPAPSGSTASEAHEAPPQPAQMSNFSPGSPKIEASMAAAPKPRAKAPAAPSPKPPLEAPPVAPPAPTRRNPLSIEIK